MLRSSLVDRVIAGSTEFANRITVATMSIDRPHNESVSSVDPLSGISPGASLWVVFAIALALATVIFGVLSASAAQPIVLTILSVLAVLGVFFLFGLAAGHIRLTERTQDSDIIRAIAERLDEGVYVTTPQSRILFGNRAAARLLGRDKLGDINNLEKAVTGSATGGESLFRLCRAAAMGQTRTEDVEIIQPVAGLKTTPNRWLRITVKPFGHVDLPHTTGPAVLWTMTDITGHRAQQANERYFLERRLSFLEDVPAGILVASEEGRIEYVNRRLSESLALAPDVADGDLWLTDIVAGDGAQLLRALRLDDEGPCPRIDLDLVRNDGTRHPSCLIVQPHARSTTASTHAGDQAKPRAFAAIVLDRDDEAEGTGDQPVANAKFEGFFRSAPFGIATLTSDGTISGANGAFSRMVLEGKQVAGRDAFQILSRDADEEKCSELRAALDDAFAGKANIAPIEFSVGETQEFTRRLFLSSLSTAKTAERAVALYVVDASDEKALERKYAQSQKMEAVGKLAGGIAHDFNNVLTAIIGFSDLLMLSHRPGDHAYNNIQNIRSSANRASELVKKLLAFSRRQTLEPTVLQLNEVVTDLSVILNRLLGEQIELKISSGRDVWAVKADRSQIDQVVINLAVNARDAMPDGGRLTVRTKNISERESQRIADKAIVCGEYVMIELEDTGVGMDQEIMGKIFEPFFTTKDIGKGTGLGLSTVYGIIKQTGGYIFADSKVGRGTVFRVYLPRHAQTEPPAQAETIVAAPARPRDLTGKGRILIVEDEDAVRIFATEALKRQGYEVLQAADGLEALDIMEDNNFAVDIVVSDVKMPEMDGPTLYREVRAKRPDLKFIFVSGYADDAFGNEKQPEDDFVFLPKPYTLAQIAETVKENIG